MPLASACVLLLPLLLADVRVLLLAAACVLLLLAAACVRVLGAGAAATAARHKTAALPTPDCHVMTVLRHQLRQPSLRHRVVHAERDHRQQVAAREPPSAGRKAIRLRYAKRGEQFWREGHLELLAVRHDPARGRAKLCGARFFREPHAVCLVLQ